MSEEDELLATSAAAEILGVHAQTLRRYEREGLISARRLPSGQRRYRMGDLVALRDAGAVPVADQEPVR